MKKKILTTVMAVGIVAGSMTSATSLAATQTKVTFDGTTISFEVDPVVREGVTLVQFRPIFEKLGYTISYNGATNVITAIIR
ncbi:stalk domain-containing protein [Saccharibacillus deserti]|uniref:stalk domain-containing protein n=1 Tax=Saccharibacillus deserti TaxID=1634444 RepID=UPI001554DAAE|nr:stalk domain-containing protein [Saccharibacillus deserti]